MDYDIYKISITNNSSYKFSITNTYASDLYFVILDSNENLISKNSDSENSTETFSEL